ncbi:MAG: hypothetical protein AABY22_01025 [Nanoarchaeota archaeon]|mgnify:CR=1 FL=1
MVEKKKIEIVRDDNNKIIEIKNIPCLICESEDTHLYKETFFCFSCKNKVKKEEAENKNKPLKFHHEYPDFR